MSNSQVWVKVREANSDRASRLTERLCSEAKTAAEQTIKTLDQHAREVSIKPAKK